MHLCRHDREKSGVDDVAFVGFGEVVVELFTLPETAGAHVDHEWQQDAVSGHGAERVNTPTVTVVVKLCATVATPVVGSAKNWAGNGPIIRS